MKSSGSKFLIGFIAGAALGALAGILLAPDKGVETRRKVADKAKKIKDDLQKDIADKIDDLKDYFNENIEDVKSKIPKAAKKAEAEIKSKKAEV